MIKKLFTLFLFGTFLLYSGTKLDIFPKSSSSLVSTIDNVIKNGWCRANNELRGYFGENDLLFQKNLKQVMTTPLEEYSDEEYIRENILAYTNSSIDFEEIGLPSRLTEEKHLEYLKSSIKYDLKWPKYKRFIDIYEYQYAFAYIKFLESKNRLSESYQLYMMIIARLRYIDDTLPKNTINGIKKIVTAATLKLSLRESLQHQYYSEKQKEALYGSLLSLFQLDEGYYNATLQEKKRVDLAYMRITVVDTEKFETFLENNHIEFEEEIFKDFDKNTLQTYFEDKKLIEKALGLYSKKIDIAINDIQNLKTHNDYTRLDNKYKKEIAQSGENFHVKIGSEKKYHLSKKEFLEIAEWAMFAFGRFWSAGKVKRDYIKAIEENQKFLKLFK